LFRREVTNSATAITAILIFCTGILTMVAGPESVQQTKCTRTGVIETMSVAERL
jgi:hypothetical protein